MSNLPKADSPPYFMGYRKIPGKPLTKEFNHETIINTLTGFLRELQDIDHSRLRKTPRYTVGSWKQEYHELHQQIIQEAYPSLVPSAQSQITEEFNRFHETDISFEPSLCHRDLGIEHILESGGKITGIIDWGDACICDPAFDLTGLLISFSQKVVKSISDRLDYPPEYLERAWFYSRVAPFYEFLYGKETQNEKHIRAGLEKIKNIFNSSIVSI